MGDYNLHGLDARDFQHLVQAIARKVISPSVVALGDGRDGNRDLTCRGRMDFPSLEEPWDGYMVLGVKFRQKQGLNEAGWAADQLVGDLAKFLNPDLKLRRPEFYIYATNVALSPVPDVGGREKIEALLQDYSKKLDLKGWALWDYNDIRGFLDGDASVRRAYGHLITAGDVLAEVMELLKPEEEDAVVILHRYLQKELLSEMAAKLQSAGDDPELQIPLTNVFVDLPCATSPSEAAYPSDDESDPLIVRNLLIAGSLVHRRSHDDHHPPDASSRDLTISRHVVVGGPGQGKSTVGQYICQLYRAALLLDRPHHLIDARALAAVEHIRKSQCDGLPEARRWPVRVELRHFASALAQNTETTLLEFIRKDISRLGAADISVKTFKNWLGTMPWLVVLDGLDEVPPSTNRAEVLKQIEAFRIDAATLNADIFLVATTRPQSYSREFGSDLFMHWYLKPLSENQALAYGTRLAAARCVDDERRRDELVKSLAKACENPATSRLMQSPLQVTIMATLVEDTGEPPQQRYRLFAEYYRAIYKRETRRKLIGGILSERQRDIDVIHATTGLLLHAASEQSVEAGEDGEERPGEFQIALSDAQFRTLVRRRLQQIEVGEPKLSELLARITDESLQRLVFLVRPREGWVQFDIASLKEFMAAEALMTGPDDVVRERLRVSGSASYWRNVFLFACGKCFVEREHLLDSIVALCAGLDEQATARALLADHLSARISHAISWGSRLALDILRDGTSRQYPGYEILFVRRAFQLLKFFEPEIVGALTMGYSSELMSVYRGELSSALRPGDVRRRSAITLLSSLASSGVEWAAELFLVECTASDFTFLLDWMFVSSVSEHMQLALERYLGETHPDEIEQLVNMGEPTQFKGLLGSALKAFKPQRITVQNASTFSSLIPKFELVSCVQDPRIWEELGGVQFSVAWEPVLAGVRFGSSPSKESLACEIRRLATLDTPIAQLFSTAQPWPLAACLRAVKTREDLLELAHAAESGALLDLADWQAAEARWESTGLLDSDHEAEVTRAFVTDEGHIVFPFSVSVDGEGRRKRPELDVPIVFSRLSATAKVRYAGSILFEMGFPEDSPALDLSDLKILTELLPMDRSWWCDPHLRRFADSKLTPDNFELFEWLGRRRAWIGGGKKWPSISEQICARHAKEPSMYPGLFHMIVELASEGTPCEFTKETYDVVRCAGVSIDTDYASALRLASKTLTPTEESEILEALASSATLEESIWRVFRILEHRDLRVAARCALFIQERISFAEPFRERIWDATTRALEEFMNNRPSSFLGDSEWSRLQMPEKV